MVRQIIKARSKDIHILIPEDYIGKTLEVLTYALDEPKTDLKKDNLTSINEIYKDIRVDFTNFTFDRDEANSR